MIDPRILEVQTEAGWTDAQLLEHIYAFIDREGSTVNLLLHLFEEREDAYVAQAEQTEEYRRCERFLLEVFPQAPNPAVAVSQFLATSDSRKSAAYITMVARKHREDPRIAPVLSEFRKALLG
jgi:hypothetical protein